MCSEITDMVLKMGHQFHESLKEGKRGTCCHFPFQQAKMSRPFHKARQEVSVTSKYLILSSLCLPIRSSQPTPGIGFYLRAAGRHLVQWLRVSSLPGDLLLTALCVCFSGKAMMSLT